MSAVQQFPYMVFHAAILDAASECDAGEGHEPRRVIVSTAESQCRAITWTPPPPGGHNLVDVCHCTALNTADSEGNWLLVLTSARPTPNARPLDYLPESACPQKGVVRGVRAIIERIEHIPLKRFVEEALSVPDLFRYFWTCPGSIRHHHARAGGLAEHSLDVAQRVYQATYDHPAHRDLGIAAALLHDIGKVWAYVDGELTPEAARLGHEQLGFERLLPHLICLREQCREMGIGMQALLSGEWRRANHSRAMAIGAMVRSADQFSAELDVESRTPMAPRSRAPNLTQRAR